ncbi:MAG: hypothetical protein NDI69_08945 [Bacteriovoracaceae bacterium]|nr:hypothetical protein [Bacteriovoracaceae bacterium]
MDKSFNDQELSDIMKEIEALEDDFSEPEETLTSPLMEELAHLDEAESIPVSPKIVALEEARPVAAPAPKAQFEASTSMSFKVHGQLNLELQFDIGGKVISLEVTEEGLNIQMEGGMKFYVPVSEKTSSKKAA